MRAACEADQAESLWALDVGNWQFEYASQMSIVVQKYGGSRVSDVPKLRRAAERDLYAEARLSWTGRVILMTRSG